MRRYNDNGGNDWDCCERSRCDNPATYTDERIDMEFCSEQCASAEIAKREFETEQNRVAEITSGGQI